METAQQASGMLKVAEVAEMTGLSEATVLREVHNGEFTAYRVGPGKKDIRITRDSALAYLERRLIRPASEVRDSITVHTATREATATPQPAAA